LGAGINVPNNRVILAYSHQPRQLPPALHAALRERLPYGRRMRLAGHPLAQTHTLVGIELARGLLARVAGRAVPATALRFPWRGRPQAPGLAHFSISHAGEWVGCAVASDGAVGFDLECVARGGALDAAGWSAREAVLKAAGADLAAAARVVFAGEAAELDGRHWCLQKAPAPAGCVAYLALATPAEIELVPPRAIAETSAFDERIPAGRHAP
jgi:phosphopantetheinyl transferase